MGVERTLPLGNSRSRQYSGTADSHCFFANTLDASSKKTLLMTFFSESPPSFTNITACSDSLKAYLRLYGGSIPLPRTFDGVILRLQSPIPVSDVEPQMVSVTF